MKSEEWLTGNMFLVYLLILSVRGNNSSANKTTDNEINEPFENENLLRIALEKHIQDGVLISVVVTEG